MVMEALNDLRYENKRQSNNKYYMSAGLKWLNNL
jgi:hypothetical protein